MSIKVGVLGATGLTGCELVQILLRHPQAEITWLSSESQHSQPYAKVYPQFQGRLPQNAQNLISMEDAVRIPVDVVFSCLPHAASAKAIGPFLAQPQTKVIDLSADFRLQNRETYETAYETVHPASEWLPKAPYGLSEIHGAQVAEARLIANPGCYPTSVLLPLIPLLRTGIVGPDDIVIDSKSGVSGAGRKPSETTHYVNANESINAYKIGDQHRHVSEIEEQLSQAAGKPVSFLFTPHLMPMERGILSTIYCRLADGASGEDAKRALREAYAGSDFVHLRDESPRTADVTRGNHCHIHVYQPKGSGKLVIVSVIDNMVKGASGQAVQNMNLAFGLKPAMGLV